jgi:peptide/nickel transport system substrate-binding protein
LLHYDLETLEPKPHLAKSWKYSADGKTLTFELNEATWSDGKPFTSADVEFSFNEVLSKYHPHYKTFFGLITNVKAVGDHTVVFEFSEPSAPALSAFFERYTFIIPKHVFQGLDIKNNEHNLNPKVTLGPYKFKEYVPGSHVTVVRNENYFIKGKPYLDAVTFRFITDTEARAIAL